MANILKQSTQIVVRIGPAVAVGDGFTPVTTLTLSGADEAELLKANGAATVDISAATFAAVTGADGWYDLTLTTSHTDTVGELVVVVNDDSLILPIYARFQVVEEAIYDALFAASATGLLPTNVTQISGDSTAADNAESFFDGTGYAGTNNVIPTVTTLTNKSGFALASTGLDLVTAWTVDITGDITGNLSGSVGSVTGLTQAGIADAVWDETAADHTTSGTTGAALGAAGSAGDPWETSLPGAYGAGTAGKIIGDNLNATVSSRASQTSVDTIDGIVDTILVDTNELQTTWTTGGTNYVRLTTIESRTGISIIRQSTAQGGAASTITLDPGASSVDDYYKHYSVKITSNTGVDQWRVIQSYNGTTKVATVVPDWDTTPDNTSGFAVIGGAPVHVYEIEPGGIVAASFAAGAIDAAAIAADAVTEIQGDKTGYKLASDGLDLVVPADPSAIPALGTSSVVAWIGYFGLWSTAEVNSDANSVDLRNSADTATVATHSTSDDGTTFISGEAT